MTGDYTDMVLELNDASFPFSNVGPYRVQIDSSEVVIKASSKTAMWLG